MSKSDHFENIGHIEKTGHQYYGTSMMAYESVDNCGTCDGARCGSCQTYYVVEDYDTEKQVYKGKDKEKAIELAGYDFCR